ncbi:MAG TPA: glutathione S-transferase family protein [Alphaproteobacteria bacterium]|jgi:glutathione S-transferase|nr:glutathione S-transferase family protein [Alphaproteobacteria bacterium]
MLKLYSTAWSPWVRKVRIAAIERGIQDKIKLIPAIIGFAEKTLKTVKSDLTKFNPSGRVPTLITEQGKAIYDSTVIIHYLDSIGSVEPIISKDLDKRIKGLKLNALVDEVIDSMRHLSLENRREQNIRLPDWIDALDKKVRRGIEVIEDDLKYLSNSNTNILDLADISVVILLGTIKRNPQSLYNIFSKDLNSWFNNMMDRKSIYDTNPPNL